MNPGPFAPPSPLEAEAIESRQLMAERDRRQIKLITASLALNFLLACALVGLTPIKEEKPYVVQLDKVTGELSAPAQQKAEEYKPSEATILFFARRFLVAHLSIQPQLNESNEALSLSYLKGDAAIAKHKQWRIDDKTFVRIAREPTLVRDVEIDSLAPVSGSPGSLVGNITLKTSSLGGQTIDRLAFTMHYEIIKPRNKQEMISHPSGMFITDFRYEAMATK